MTRCHFLGDNICMFSRDRRLEMERRMMDYKSHDSCYRYDVNSMGWDRSVGQQGEEYSTDLEDMLTSLREEIRCYMAYNNKLIEV